MNKSLTTSIFMLAALTLDILMQPIFAALGTFGWCMLVLIIPFQLRAAVGISEFDYSSFIDNFRSLFLNEREKTLKELLKRKQQFEEARNTVIVNTINKGGDERELERAEKLLTFLDKREQVSLMSLSEPVESFLTLEAPKEEEEDEDFMEIESCRPILN